MDKRRADRSARDAHVSSIRRDLSSHAMVRTTGRPSRSHFCCACPARTSRLLRISMDTGGQSGGVVSRSTARLGTRRQLPRSMATNYDLQLLRDPDHGRMLHRTCGGRAAHDASGASSSLLVVSGRSPAVGRLDLHRHLAQSPLAAQCIPTYSRHSSPGTRMALCNSLGSVSGGNAARTSCVRRQVVQHCRTTVAGRRSGPSTSAVAIRAQVPESLHKRIATTAALLEGRRGET